MYYFPTAKENFPPSYKNAIQDESGKKTEILIIRLEKQEEFELCYLHSHSSFWIEQQSQQAKWRHKNMHLQFKLFCCERPRQLIYIQ